MAKSAADYYVKSLPGAPTDEPLRTMHAGHIEITPEHHGNLFFWHVANRHIADRSRTVIWLNGGPGCSSEDGALMEIGPYRVKKDGTLKVNDGAWDEFANLLFLDQPVGTGFSYVDSDSYVRELTKEADQFILFMEKFFDLFPEYATDDIYLAGESYAGQHIPYFARAMLDHNKNTAGQKWNLSGLLIGNGWISGVDQYDSTVQFALEHGLLERGSEDYKKLEGIQNRCTQDLSDGRKDSPDSDVCEGILREILRISTKQASRKGKCANMYDVRLSDEYPSCGMNWPPDLEQLVPYLRRKDVIEALHVNKDKKTGWTECAGQVGAALKNRNSHSSREFLPALLAEVPIVLFSGDQDLICNHLGTEELINNLSFNGGKGLELEPGVWAPRLEWTFEAEPAGYYQSARNLTYILFYNSSHMVPFDYPRRTRDMLDRFMGVDIASIGGKPTDSRIDGLKGVQVSVGAHPNSTAAVEAEKTRVKQAAKHAYYKSGQVVLIVVLIAAGVWGWVVWRGRVARRKRGGAGGAAYSGLMSGRNLGGKGGGGDLETADFDEAELDDLTRDEGRGDDEFHVGLDSDEDDDDDDGRHDYQPREAERVKGKGKST